MIVTSAHPVFPEHFSQQTTVRTIRDGTVRLSTAPATLTGTADTIDLSALAQLILSGFDGISSGTGFILSPEQQRQFDAIIAEHRGEPFTQDNFDRLLDDLRSAGLAPEQLALEDHLRFFDLTSILLDAAGGNNPGVDFNVALNTLATPILPDEQANVSDYLLHIIRQWQGIALGSNDEGMH